MSSRSNGRGRVASRERREGGQVVEMQRRRLLLAFGEVVAEGGLEAGIVGRVCEQAGVSRRTFYELFADREACFLAAFDQVVQLAGGRVVPAFQSSGRWRDRIRAALVGLLVFLDEEPELGALCVVHALGAGPQALAERARVVRSLAGAVDEGGGEARRGSEPGPLAAEGVVGAVLAVLHARLCEPSRGPLTELAGPLMGMVVL